MKRTARNGYTTGQPPHQVALGRPKAANRDGRETLPRRTESRSKASSSACSCVVAGSGEEAIAKCMVVSSRRNSPVAWERGPRFRHGRWAAPRRSERAVMLVHLGTEQPFRFVNKSGLSSN